MSGADYEEESIVYRKRIFAIDSRERDIVKYPNANNFVVRVEQEPQNVISIKLVDIQIPKTDYNVNEFNNGFVLVDNAVEYPIQLPVGDYDLNELIVQLENQITPLATTNTYSFQVVNGKLVVRGEGGVLPFQLLFAPPAEFADEIVSANGGTKNLICYRQSARAVLGFDIADYTSTTISLAPNIGEIVSPYKVDLTGDNYVLLDLGLQETCVNSQSQEVDGTFYKVPLASPGNAVTFNVNDHRTECIMQTPIVRLRDFHVKLKTFIPERLYNLRGLNYSFTLEIKSAPN
jgi:hypothetical protein